MGNRSLRGIMFLLAALGASATVAAGEISEGAVECDKAALLAAADAPPAGLQYAPDRRIDILHLIIDVTPDFKKRTIGGKTTLRFVPIASPLAELRLDAVDIRISSVESSAKIAGYQSTADALIITFEKPIPAGTESTVTIAHDAEPQAGLYFRTREMGYKPGDDHLFTQGEAIEARHWFPGFDSPNEKFTSEVICHVPDGMIVLSNGKKMSEEKDAKGLTAVRWLQDQPHPNYLIALCAGYFKAVEDKHGDLPLAFYVPPSYINEAASSFDGTKDMVEFFEQDIGVKYPWAKYYQVIVDDFVAGGMENTSLTIETTRTLFTPESENIRSSEGLVSHELAHQWFGDYVTCKDWSQTWLNEGFATFYAWLYAGHKHGPDQMKYELFQTLESITAQTKDVLPIVNKSYDDPNEQFSYRSYGKAGWVLRMLRSELGDDVYRKAIKAYLEKHGHGNVVTEDLNQAMEAASGRSLDQFFNQWVYHGRNPELEVSYRWLADKKLARVSVKQTQEANDKVLLFNFPLKLRFKGKSGATDYDAIMKERQQDFYVPLAEMPRTVRIDPELTLLAKIKFDQPAEMLYAQLGDKDDVIGRVLACRQLAEKDDKKTVEQLKTALNGDAFHGVRTAAAIALGKIHSEEAFAALAGSTEQRDARVRQSVISEIGGFFSNDALASVSKSAANEKNPDIASAALRGLGKYPADAATHEIITKALASNTYNQSLAVAAIGTIHAQDTPEWIGPLKETLTKREGEFTSRGMFEGLACLGYIARNQENKTEVREFLKGYLNHKKKTVRVGAISALGELRDPSALGVVEAAANTAEGRGNKQFIDGALASLRDSKKVPVELKDLRTEVLDLKKKNEKMEKDLEDLKKQAQAGGSSPANPAKKQARSKFLGIF